MTFNFIFIIVLIGLMSDKRIFRDTRLAEVRQDALADIMNTVMMNVEGDFITA